MLNLLFDYISDSLPHWGDFTTNPNLMNKVSPAGELLPYRGNTVVFLLDDDTKRKLKQIQEHLYRAAPDMLTQPLREDTFHMTLHDLVNGHPNRCGLTEEMRSAEEHAVDLLVRWKDIPPLPMRATWLFNMVNTSIVLGLAPANDEAWRQLDGMYTALEAVVRLGYAMTPHVTMAYFRPGVYHQEQVQRLREALCQVDLQMTLTADNLVLQNFEDMNQYQTVVTQSNLFQTAIEREDTP